MKLNLKSIIVIIIAVVLIILFLSSFNQKPQNIFENIDPETQETSNRYDTQYYRTLVPQPISETRGIANNMVSQRQDFSEIEEGLMKIATNFYSTNDYIYIPGQVFKKAEVYAMLAREKSPEEVNALLEQNENYEDRGLNQELPAGADEADYRADINTIVEQNYLVKVGDDYHTAGIGIGLGISKYANKNDILTNEQITEIGVNAANKIIYQLRKQDGYKDVDIFFGFYALEKSDSLSPGSYVSYGISRGTNSTISEITYTGTEIILFPSTAAEIAAPDINTGFLELKKQVAGYFPNYTGVYGFGHYTNGKIDELQIFIPVEFYSQAEVIAFTQFIADRTEDIFSNSFDMSIEIFSNVEQEALITRPANQKMNIYIY